MSFFRGGESRFEPVLWQSHKKSSQVQRKPSSACKRKARCDSFLQGNVSLILHFNQFGVKKETRNCLLPPLSIAFLGKIISFVPLYIETGQIMWIIFTVVRIVSAFYVRFIFRDRSFYVRFVCLCSF